MITNAVQRLRLTYYIGVSLLSTALAVEVGSWLSSDGFSAPPEQLFETAIHFLVLIILILAAIFIFRPAINKLQSMHHSVAQREQQLTQILSDALEGYAVIDPETFEYREVNHGLCAMLGYRPEEMIGNRPLDFCDDENAEIFRQNASRIGKTHHRQYFVTMRHKNGQSVHTQYSANTAWNDDGTPNFAYAFITDISKLKETEQALINAKEGAEQATELKDKFVALVAHDLRNPIGAIKGFMEMLLLDQKEPLAKKHQKSIQYVFKQTQELLKLINDLLDLSKLETGALSLKKTFLDAHYLAELICHRLELQATTKNITLVNDIPTHTRIFADEVLYSQVLQNLISNAIKFSHEGSEIRLFKQDEDQPTIAIEDSGVGLEQSMISQLFDIEEKTSTHGTAGETGTGFGLPLSKKIMEAHGGDIRVQSQKDEGSTFSMVLPPVRPTVMVVEDSRSIRSIVRDLLLHIGAEVVEVENGKQALDHIREKAHIDLVITDIRMPEMDGIQLLMALQELERPDMCPVVVLTGSDDKETKQKCLALGAADYTVKPIVPDDFMVRIRQFIG